ncbi:FAD-dependent monooxygenase [Sorangium sp. So ce118]
MNQSLSTQVLIVGAGPTGLTLACDLARRGVPCRIIDRTPAVSQLARAGGTERLRAAYLIGADGGRSFVRRALGVGFEGETLEAHRALVGDVRADGLDRDRWHVWPKASGGPVALCPLPGTDRFQIMVPLPGELDDYLRPLVAGERPPAGGA